SNRSVRRFSSQTTGAILMPSGRVPTIATTRARCIYSILGRVAALGDDEVGLVDHPERAIGGEILIDRPHHARVGRAVVIGKYEATREHLRPVQLQVPAD